MGLSGETDCLPLWSETKMSNTAAVVLPILTLLVHTTVGETIAHLYRPGLDGRPTYAHGEENPLERGESVGIGVYINTHSSDDQLNLAKRHFLDQPMQFPFGKPDLLFDQPGREGSGEVDQENLKVGSDHLDGDYHHLFYEGSLEAPEYFEEYFDEGFALDYEYPQANYEDQGVQDEEQV